MITTDLERRAATLAAEGSVIKGYAIVFGTLSEDLGGFREIIEATAVDRTLAGGDVRALVDHDPSKVLGRRKAGTLKLEKDARGLLVTITPPDTTVGRDTLALVGRGDVSGMSFTFEVVRPGGERFERRGDQLVRIVSDAIIHEVSVVTFPSYTATDVQVARRSLEAFTAGAGPRVDWLRKIVAMCPRG